MFALRLVVAALFMGLGMLIAVSAVHGYATGRDTQLSANLPGIIDHGLMPGLVCISTAVILFFLPRNR